MSGRGELSGSLAARIVEHINAAKLPSGTHVAAQELADRFSVSRSPINQALRLLHEKGVLEHAPNRGYMVGEAANLSASDLGLPVREEVTDAYERIAADRSHGRLPAQVSEALIRKRYGLTRAQALAVLGRIAQEGWAERRPGYGWEFSEMLTTPESLIQTYRARMALEPAALLEPGYHLDADTIERLRDTELQLLDGALENMPAAALHERGVVFHESIVGAGGNPFLLDALRRINRVRRLLSYRGMSTRERYYEHAREHLDILKLLEQGRNTEAAETLRAHLVTVVRNLERLGPVIAE
ncbi:GntR family transcriptional regulator [Amaricoccus sp. W119]|uniref:GntR family transcriptional regulator n=1 Tax=Amaricoccus sp. W119 TaxID=3391833 RepID=UPI0039A56712